MLSSSHLCNFDFLSLFNNALHNKDEQNIDKDKQSIIVFIIQNQLLIFFYFYTDYNMNYYFYSKNQHLS